MEEISILENIQTSEIEKIKDETMQIYSIWNELGIEQDQMTNKVQTLWKNIHSLIEETRVKEVLACEEIKERVKEYPEKISELSKILSVESPLVSGLTLLRHEEVLHREFNKLTEIKNSRLEELKELMDLENNYRSILGIEEFKFSFKYEVPSSSELNEIQQYVKALTEEYKKRKIRYLQYRQQLLSFYEETETSPESSFEKDLFEGKEPLFLSDDVFVEIVEILDKAKKRKSELEGKKKVLMGKLNALWERLNVDTDLKKNFISNHLNCKASTMKSIQDELDKYEKIKLDNIKSFIEFSKQELKELWFKCAVSENKFHLYSSAEATEGVLVALEEQVAKWKSYYEEVKEILEKMEKRNKLWDLLIDLDRKAVDPARFKNRGGNLLKEEKERNKLQKSLPALEEEICEKIDKYEAESGKEFLYFDENVRAFISKQWEQRFSSKENQKEKLEVFTPTKRPPHPTLKRCGSSTPKITLKTAKDLSSSRQNSIKKKATGILKDLNKTGAEL